MKKVIMIEFVLILDGFRFRWNVLGVIFVLLDFYFVVYGIYKLLLLLWVVVGF